MPVSNTFDFYKPEARYLADLYGIRADIGSVVEIVKTFLSYEPINPHRDLWQRNALCISALATYGRTLGEGVRQALPIKFVQALGPERLESHKYFKDLRDKWAAHSVNNLEESGVTLQASVTDGKVTIHSIGDRHRNTAVLSKADMLRLGQLCEQLYDAVQSEIRTEKDRLLELLSSMDLSALASDPSAYSIPSLQEQPAKPRSRYGS